jgi:rod shape-determining protein MreD
MRVAQRVKLILIGILFLLFIVEGAIVPWLIPGDWQTRVVPHLTYIVILFFAVYDNRHTALVLGLIFGLLQDIVYYGALIGAYSFAMGLSCYIIGLIFGSRRSRAPMPLMMIVVLIGSMMLDSILFGTYSLFELVHLPYTWALMNHIIPNMFFHFIFALAVYVPLRRQLEIMGKRRTSSDDI